VSLSTSFFVPCLTAGLLTLFAINKSFIPRDQKSFIESLSLTRRTFSEYGWQFASVQAMIFTLLSSIWRLDPEYAFHLEGDSRQPELPEELLIEVPSSGTNH
jgi:hypothetical protein